MLLEHDEHVCGLNRAPPPPTVLLEGSSMLAATSIEASRDRHTTHERATEDERATEHTCFSSGSYGLKKLPHMYIYAAQ
jgi:hypothetical protein